MTELNKSFLKYDNQDYIQELKITLSFLQIPQYDLFANLICNASAELSHYPEDFDIYAIRDIELLSIFMRDRNRNDFTRTLCHIQELLDLISEQTTGRIPKLVANISTSFKKVLKYLRDAIYSQGLVVDGKRVAYHPLMPQTIAWQFFVDFKKSLSVKDYSAAITRPDLANEQKKERPELQPLRDKARFIYEKLITLQPHEAMTLPQIQNWLYDTYTINLDEGTWKKIRKELIPYGLKNRPRVGYYIKKK